ncbi:hypothetical protein K7X08_034525 [Anisodus acutangulus]|uniref:Uncharacterized protein n=1 Tax=Anisodus acutangulus TaxID=402998 RepID=A0A9Q1LFX4_9SOLA|nr:hypothetical protein K7X08_034525 [Anisodus acutangulus]
MKIHVSIPRSAISIPGVNIKREKEWRIYEGQFSSPLESSIPLTGHLLQPPYFHLTIFTGLWMEHFRVLFLPTRRLISIFLTNRVKGVYVTDIGLFVLVNKEGTWS